MKNTALLGWGGLICGLIGMIYTMYHDVVWDRYEGWTLFATMSHIAVALCVLAIIAGGMLIVIGARRRAG